LNKHPVLAEAYRQAAAVPGGAARPLPAYEPVTIIPQSDATHWADALPAADDNARGL
jgi:hypothetical protein